MAYRTWIKLDTDWLFEPEFGTLPDYLWRRAVELHMLASMRGNDGALPPLEVIAWQLRLSPNRLIENLHALAEVGLVHEAQPGQWLVTGFRESQYSESFERMKRYRERNGKEGCYR